MAQSLGHKPFDNAGHCATVRLGSRRNIAHQFGVQRAGLPARCLQPTIRREVGMHGYELLFKGDGADQIQEERLARSVFADYKPNAGAAIGDPFDVSQERFHLFRSADLDQMQCRTWNHSGTERLENGVAVFGTNGCH
jgi:hypothetical protein